MPMVSGCPLWADTHRFGQTLTYVTGGTECKILRSFFYRLLALGLAMWVDAAASTRLRAISDWRRRIGADHHSIGFSTAVA
jgi:hypothetical protein